MNRRPLLKNKKKICIICEGFEEYEYIAKLISLDVWNDCYEFILINAESNGKIPARYQDAYAKDCYDIVLAFCDTDQKPYEDYETIKEKINTIHGNENSANQIIIFANPCTMQVILLHFADLRLESHKKEDNKKYIKKFTGVAGYRAKKSQRDEFFSKIDVENYKMMMKYCQKLYTNDEKVSSSNFFEFATYFQINDTLWIDKINEFLES